MSDHIQKPTAGWAVEVTGERIDLDDLRELLKRPFDPWVEDFDDEGNARLLLRSEAWAGADDSSLVLEHAGRMVTRINGAKLIIQNDTQPVALGALFRFREDGTRQPIIIAATGHFKLSGCRVRGRAEVISKRPPPPPEPSSLQNWIQAAESDDDRADQFEHLARADNWYDVYKSAEIIRRIAGGKRRLRPLLGS